MMAGNPNSWSMHPQSSLEHHQLSVSSNSQKFVYGGSNNITSSASADNNPNLNQDDFPIRSWSQFILGEGRFGDDGHFQQQKDWEEQVSTLNPYYSSFTRQQVPIHADVKQEQLVQPGTSHLYDARRHDETIYVKNTNDHLKATSNYEWPPQTNQLIKPSSNSFLDFVEGNKNQNLNQHQHQHNQLDQSSECNSSTSNRGGVSKKARFQQSSSQPAFKVRKEKLGDRITALHQLVSPFGKTDTASVLSEAICCIRYLQSQIEALSSPYMRNASSATASTNHHQRSEFQSQGNLLRSRGLCLVPISCTQNVGNDGNAADYWDPNYH